MSVCLSGRCQFCLRVSALIVAEIRVWNFDLKFRMLTWDTDLNKSDDFLLDPYYIYNIYAMFCFVFSANNYTNKILFKLMLTSLMLQTERCPLHWISYS